MVIPETKKQKPHVNTKAPFSSSLVQRTHLPSPSESGRISSLEEVVMDTDCIQSLKRAFAWSNFTLLLRYTVVQNRGTLNQA